MTIAFTGEIVADLTIMLFVSYILVEVVKATESVDKKHLPLFSVVIGLVAGLLIAYFKDFDLVSYAIGGIIAGWGASGGHDTSKSISELFLGGKK